MRASLLVFVSACSFSGALVGEQVPADAQADAPSTIASDVQVVEVNSAVTEVLPGSFGLRVQVGVENKLSEPVSGVLASLAIGDDREDELFWRDADEREGVTAQAATTIGPGEVATFDFVVEVSPSADPTALVVGGSVSFDGPSGRLLAEPVASLSWEVTAMAEIVVDTEIDETTNAATVSFRDALNAANFASSPARIRFDPGVFPSGAVTEIVLNVGLGQLPVIDAASVVIDGAGVAALVADAPWTNSQAYGLRSSSANAVISGLEFRDFGAAFPFDSSVSTANNCGAGAAADGGAIRVSGGRITLVDNVFSDQGVAERNCQAALVRFAGGAGHRVIRNRFVEQSMDSLLVTAAVAEVSDNWFGGGPASDDGIIVLGQSGSRLWILGNVFVDNEVSAVLAVGTSSDELVVVNNTFLRNSTQAARSAFRREPSPNRPLTLGNNVYAGNGDEATFFDAAGNNVDASAESYIGVYCENCPNAVLTAVQEVASLGLVDATGATPADLALAAGSLLIDTGFDRVDRNGRAPRWFNGTATDRGAFESN